ncbi:MAG: metal ABC transporter permease, partial [Ktedonobacterales bacterium]
MPLLFADAVQPSWDLVADVQLLLQYHFMQNAFIGGTLVAIIAGVMGYFMVVRGQSFAGHSLANVGFAGATGAALVGLPAVAGLFLAGILAAGGIHFLGLGTRETRRSDIAIGAVFTASLALGYLFVQLATGAYAASIYGVLFGNVVGISDGDVAIIGIAAVALLVVMAIIGRPLLFASLDADVAAAK